MESHQNILKKSGPIASMLVPRKLHKLFINTPRDKLFSICGNIALKSKRTVLQYPLKFHTGHATASEV